MTTHQDAINTLTDATTTGELAAAINAFTDLRIGTPPGIAPGVPDDAPDGHYINGFHLFTKTGTTITATLLSDLPDHTHDLWSDMSRERRDQNDIDQLVAEQRRGRGRPAVGRAIPVRMPQWQIDALDRDARAAGVERAALIRALVAKANQAIRLEAAETGAAPADIIRELMNGRAS